MIRTEHGSWPFGGPLPANLQFFRHTRLTQVRESTDERQFHVQTVCLVTYAVDDVPVFKAGIVGEGFGEWVEDAQFAAGSLPFPTDELSEITLSSIFSSGRKGERESNDFFTYRLDAEHEYCIHLLKSDLNAGLVQKKQPPPCPGQAAYGW